MKQYLELDQADTRSRRKKSRTAPAPAPRVFSATRCALISSQGFPLVTTKKVHLKSILHELLWFIRGDTNIRYLVENGVGIWNDWPYQSWLRETGQEEPPTACIRRSGRRRCRMFIERIKEDDAVRSSSMAISGQSTDTSGATSKEWISLPRWLRKSKPIPTRGRLIVSAWEPQRIFR